MTKRSAAVYLFSIGSLLLLVAWHFRNSFANHELEDSLFDGERAYADVQTQVSFGPRTPSSDGHTKVRAWIQSELASAGWSTQIHMTSRMGHEIQNIVASRNGDPPAILLGAHYDTRFFADRDPDPNNQHEPVPGANDGASGVAVLLELARILPVETVPIWLVFFDAEDNGQVEGWDWILGSRAFVEEVNVQPQAVIILDMIGDADLELYYEKYSDLELREQIWKVAADLGYGKTFVPVERHSLIDDHLPFLEAGIPAVDIIDFDYSHWHTIQDTPDKVSAASLRIVGDTIRHWIDIRNAK